MARENFYSFPLDKPHITKPGTLYVEADAPGNASHLYLPPESPERAAKGDLGMMRIPGLESKALSHPGLPFQNLKSGK